MSRVLDEAAPASMSAPEPRRVRHRSPMHHMRPPALGFALTLPGLALVGTFVLFPLGFAVYISLTDWPLIGSVSFVGLDNYTALMDDSGFWKACLFTLLYTAVVTVPILVIGYVQAMVARSTRRSAVAFRTIYFLPYVIGLATESFLLVVELQPGSGGVNFLLEALGVTDGQTAWLRDTWLGLLVVSVLVVWYGSGLTMILLLGGMNSVPVEVLESAALDGAGGWRREISIVVPLIRRNIAMSLVLSIIGSLLAFNQFWILTQGGPGTSTTTAVMWVYQTAFISQQVGAATAGALVIIVAIALISGAQMFLLRDKEA